LVPLLAGKTIEDRSLFWHYPHYGNQGGEPSSIIRKGDWKLIHYYEDSRKELYNLKTDIGEHENVAKENHTLVLELSKELFSYLKEVDAKFPTKDSLYNWELEKKYLEDVVSKRLPGLEAQRLKFLSKDFDPKNKWWGSKVTKD